MSLLEAAPPDTQHVIIVGLVWAKLLLLGQLSEVPTSKE